ncbi:MAG: DUF1211 domain-containing protein [Aeromicrobium sp.]|nr:DUF1211 domain-containing protein [Burkholderiales bacterium]
MSVGYPFHAMSKHRIDALADGIFAVAMTLLVIELKIPESAHIKDNAGLLSAFGHLFPKFVSWVISFFVLALFWFGHHRVFHYVKHVDGRLIALNLLFLAFVSLMPFASALSGEYVMLMASQVFYSANMIMVALFALLISRYVHLHPALCNQPMSTGVYRAARFRTGMLMVISILAMVIGYYVPAAGNSAFMLMMVVGPIARRIEAKDHSLSNETRTLSI